MHYRFGDVELDSTSYCLMVSGAPRHVEPRVFDLIRFFVERNGDVLTRDDLIESVWQNRIVSDTTIAGTVKSARKALGDDGDKQRYIQTVRGRGFRFVESVELMEPESPEIEPVYAAPDRLPSIVILPFLVFGDEKALTPLADGVVENLTTVLTRVPLLRIISRTSSFAYRDRSYTTEDVRKELKVDFLIEGSLQRTADGVCLNVQLIECAQGFHTWAQRFNSSADTTVLDDLLEQVTARIEPQIVRCSMELLQNDPSSPSAKSLLLQAMGILSLKGWRKESFEASSELLTRVIALDPRLALAHAYHALILGLGHRVGLLERSAEIVERAVAAAEKAIDLDDMDSTVVSLAGCALADVGQPERAVPLIERAIELNSANGHAWAALGSAQALLGDFESACENLHHGISISPADGRRAVWCAVLAIARLLSGAPGEAAEAAEEGCRHDQRNYIPKLVLSGARLVEGKVSQADAAMLECLRVKPDLSRSEITSLLGKKLGDTLDGLRSRLS
ncbi:MAG: winged helix-turn-helix domain-containing tetratricopeptide repeat protein [Granulosicoccus sp.]